METLPEMSTTLRGLQEVCLGHRSGGSPLAPLPSGSRRSPFEHRVSFSGNTPVSSGTITTNRVRRWSRWDVEPFQHRNGLPDSPNAQGLPLRRVGRPGSVGSEPKTGETRMLDLKLIRS